MKLEEFDAFMEKVLDTLDDNDKDEYYGTDRDVCEAFLNTARSIIFGAEIVRQNEYKLYLELKAKFEPESK